jgi:DNA-binding Lrp family transcriptional regulator
LRRRLAGPSLADVEAFVYVATRPGKVEDVYAQIKASKGVRHVDIVVGDWDILVSVFGPDLPAIALDVLRSIHRIDGVARTMTTPVVPPDVIGLAGGGLVAVPMQRSGEACFVRIRTVPQKTTHVFEQLAEMDEVAGVALVAGDDDMVVEIPHPWNDAAQLVLEQVLAIEGVLSTSTLVALPPLPAEDEDRDQFSAWS